MLILARKVGQAVVIADGITVRVLEVRGGQVRLGVEAPDDVAVHREEIYQRILEENRRAAAQGPDDLAEAAVIFTKRSSRDRESPEG